MHRIAALLIGGLIVGGVLFGGVASAHEVRSGNNSTVSKTEVIDNTLFIAGNTVTIDGEVNGDVFCAGQNITISGSIHGDVICGGQTIRINGHVDGDVRLAGQTISIGSAIDGNATVVGQSFVLESTGAIGGDMSLGSESATLNGPIKRDLGVGGTTVTLSSEVGRNIKGGVDKLSLTSTAVVKGDIQYESRNDIDKAAEAQVQGKTTRTMPKETGSSKKGAVFGFTIMWFLYWLLAMMAIALSLALLFPGLLRNIANGATPRPWKALLIGFLASLAVPVILILLALTVIGIPLALVLGLMWLVITLVSGPTAGYYLGHTLLPNAKNTLYIMFVGAGILTFLYFIPFIGFIALLLSFWIGSGMILLELMRRTPRPVHVISHDSKPHKSKSS